MRGTEREYITALTVQTDGSITLEFNTLGKSAVREEVVRCRECKFYLEEHKWCYHFEDSEFCPEPDGFCAWGERRADG